MEERKNGAQRFVGQAERAVAAKGGPPGCATREAGRARTCKAENGKAIAKMDTRFEPLEEFHTDAKARFAALQQKAEDAPTQDQISAIQQQIDNQSDQPSVGSIVFHCYRTSG